MQDMFSNKQQPEIENDLFGQYYKKDKFLWAVGVFSGNGALEIIRYALDAHLEIFFPHKLNKYGNFVPLWMNYMFIEYIPLITIQVCRQSSKFINFISFDGRPELVYKDAINECIKLLKLGKYNYSCMQRALRSQNFEKGTIVRVINDDNFNGKLVRLLCNVSPDIPENKRIPVELGNVRMMIEIRKLWM